jgi:hypothetical protein
MIKLLGVMKLRLIYWRIFNFVGRRVLAPGFIAVGLILAAVNIPTLFPGGSVNLDGSPSNDIVFRLFGVILPLLVAALGIALYRSRPYYPRGLIEGGQPDT